MASSRPSATAPGGGRQAASILFVSRNRFETAVLGCWVLTLVVICPPPSLSEQSTQRASGGADHCSFAVWDRLLREWPVGNYRGVLRDSHNFQALSYRTRVIAHRSLSQQTVMASRTVAGGVIFVNVSTPASPLCFDAVSRVVASARERSSPSQRCVWHLA